ncbi:MAG: RNA polymerase sigma factor [Candidatus Eremiobacteraeota bacterium]|nr:RNA polymerase sigma factor [Candidatus Eremiobacteraeota bacterium]
MKVLRDAAACEDIVQRVFLNVWSRPQAFRGGNIESWLTTVSRNAARDHVRRASREMHYARDAATGIFDASIRSVEDEAVRRALYDAIRNAVLRLDGPRRRAMHAAFIEDQTYERVAALTSVPLGTIKTRIRSSIAELRRTFAEASERALI